MYTKITENIQVTVTPIFLDDETNVENCHFVWAYHIKIENLSNMKVKLISRKWIITDACGAVEVVEGEGVVGLQPELESGDVFEYTSGVPLSTACGFMEGHYYMITEFDEEIIVDIPIFSLDSPYNVCSLH